MDMLVMYRTHGQHSQCCPISNQKVFAPTVARAMMIAHADPFDMLESYLWTSGFIGWRLGKDSQHGLQREPMAQRSRL